jgi:asparagine synthase (glutamine-hydrolysing)
MCGICGVWNLNGERVDPALLVRMRDVMAHRGPDGEGIGFASSDGGAPLVVGERPRDDERYDVGFGHRRLAIVDLQTGDQPMTNEDGSVLLVANGEIYNHLELRHHLQARGHRFKTRCDVEVIVHLYEEHGPDFPDMMDGIFAFALFDTRKRKLVLCRDQIGVKPLYYATSGERVVFGSELKAILEHPSVPRELDVDALSLCLTFRYTPAPRTLLRHVRKLAPGSLLEVSRAGVTTRRYWNGSGGARRARGADWVERLTLELTESVRRQLMSDVPLGLSLSSGVDSATLLAIMARASSSPVLAFTIGFAGDERRSEIPAARELAGRFGATFHSRVVSDSDYASLMSRYMWHLEEPIGNESAAAYYFVAEMAHESGVKVLLTGQGPDELFAGYDRYFAPAYGRLLRPAAAPVMREPMRRLLGDRPVREQYERMISFAGGASEADAIASMWSLFGPGTESSSLLAPEIRRQVAPGIATEVVAGELSRAPAGATALERLLWLDTRTVLPENLLLAEDKMAMAAGVEARVPFLDVRYVELAEQVPGKLKLRGLRDKHIHRQVCSGIVGKQASTQKKIGFANPMRQWLRGALGNELRSQLTAPGSLASSYLDLQAVRQLLDEHTAGNRDHTKALFLLYSLEQWHAVWLGGERPGPARASSPTGVVGP